MSTRVEVEFAGLFLYARDEASQRVCVLAPDCRYNRAVTKHEDGTIGIPHVTYLRLDAASVGVAVPAGGNDPVFEFVHRLEPCRVSLAGLDGTGAVTGAPRVPSLDAPDVALRDGLISEAAPTGLAFRLMLEGGKFGERYGNKSWVFPTTLKDTFVSQVGKFEGSVKWTTTAADAVTLTLAPMDGTASTSLALHPVDDGTEKVIRIKFANLCAENPLEWDTFPLREVREDVDFKWLFRLLDDKSRHGDWKTRLDGREFPYLVLEDGPQTEGDQDCTGGKITVSFP